MNNIKFTLFALFFLIILQGTALIAVASEGHILMGTGGNYHGQLGDGTYYDRHTPVQIATEVAQVAAGLAHTLYVKTDGTLWAMGWNYVGQLGDGTTTSRSTPVLIATDVSQVAAGGYHSLFVKTDGTLWAMGSNYEGQLGVVTKASGYDNNPHPTPLQVDTGVAQVVAGKFHSLYVKTSGTLWAMGYNFSGQLGDGTDLDRHTPVLIEAGVAQVAAGEMQSRFVKSNGTLWQSSLKGFTQIATGVSQAAVGDFHYMYVKTDGTLWASGYNKFGQLGDGTTTNRSPAVQVATEVAQVAATSNHTLYIKTNGTLWAMGYNEFGQLGEGTTADRSTPVHVATIIAQIATGGDHSMFLQASELPDSDSDGLLDALEEKGCSNLFDADTDDDGIPDGDEDANLDGAVDSDETDPCDSDTDGDGIPDGIELGYTLSDIGPGTDLSIFLPDMQPASTTNPRDADTDDDGLTDGEEDTNQNGAMEMGETDPLNPGVYQDNPLKTGVKGTVTYKGKPVVAMVLANGKYKFSNSKDGSFNLTDVPYDSNGQITLYAFCSGLAPYKSMLFAGIYNTEIELSGAESGKQLFVIVNSIAESLSKVGWVDISGTVMNESGTPLCAMVLANGKYMFTCNSVGEYNLTVPLDSNGRILLYGFCSGFMPYKVLLDGDPT